MDRNSRGSHESEWLSQVLEEVGLSQFFPKLTNDLQLTKLSHFDFVSEEDLIQLGLSKPAAKRLLAAIKKRKSFVTTLKNSIVNKFIPISGHNYSSKSKYFNNSGNQHHQDLFIGVPTSRWPNNLSSSPGNTSATTNSSEFSRLTCLINSQDIQVKEEIGNGVHGFVKKGEWTAPNGRVVEVALKILRKDVMSAEPGASFNDFVKEITVMHQLNHPNIIKLYGVVLSSPMMMVTELAPYGNLRDKLRKANGHTPISQLINFSVQIANGMQYLESKRLVHRDLAARNIFVTHGRKILIGDLGLMRAIPGQESHYVMSEKTKIPYPWCAPESLRSKQFSSASDVYMFGVTLWEIFSFGKEPWAKLNLNEILENISSQKKRLPCPEACPTMVYQTLLQCWNTEPTCRPNFSTLLQYLSTSYPLEVIATQHISEFSQTHRLNETSQVSEDISDSFCCPTTNAGESLSSPERGSERASHVNRTVLNCTIEDRILVIDGQPEKYWWKGQNQRSFEIGWFPLCSTRWLAPKRGSNYISKPLKNSFVHTGHCGQDGRWGNPKFIDQMYLRHPLEPDDVNSLNANRISLSGNATHQSSRAKAKAKLARMFGITSDTPNHHANNLLAHSYHKLINEKAKAPFKFKGDSESVFGKSLARSQSQNEFDSTGTGSQFGQSNASDEPPLIDFSDEQPSTGTCSNNTTNNISTSNQNHNETSLIDMDMDTISFPAIPEVVSAARRASETNLDAVSWDGSWNTGTFYGSSNNIYSAYYCPQDVGTIPATSQEEAPEYKNQPSATAVPLRTAPPPPLPPLNPNSRYYSAVASDDASGQPYLG